mgnify:CR=1 FL=1
MLGALSPRTRNAQVALYQSGEVDFMVATDAIGMGINMDVDHVAFAAREDKKIDKRSGVSQRLPISVLENVISNAERRALVAAEKVAVPRIVDIYAALPSITGKPASGPMSPRPSTRVPSETIAIVLPRFV